MPFPVELLAPEDDPIPASVHFELRLRPLPPATTDASIACYASGGREPEIHRSGGTVSVTVPRGFAPGRARINCTQPAENGRWRWFGRQFTVRDASSATPPE